MTHIPHNDGFTFSAFREHRLMRFAMNGPEKNEKLVGPLSLNAQRLIDGLMNEGTNKEEIAAEIQKTLMKDGKIDNDDLQRHTEVMEKRLKSLPSINSASANDLIEAMSALPKTSVDTWNFIIEHRLLTGDQIDSGLRRGILRDQRTSSAPRATIGRNSPGNTEKTQPRSRMSYDKNTKTITWPDGTTMSMQEYREFSQAKFRMQDEMNRPVGLDKNAQIMKKFNSMRGGGGDMAHDYFDRKANMERYAGVPLGYVPRSGNDDLFDAHIARNAQQGGINFKRGNSVYSDMPIARTATNKNGDVINRANEYDSFMAQGNNSSIFGERLKSDAIDPALQTNADAFGSARRRRTSDAQFNAQKNNSFNKIDTNGPEAQRQINEFYKEKNTQAILNDYADLENHSQKWVRDTYADVLSRLNDSVKKLGFTEPSLVTRARDRLDKLRLRAEERGRNDAEFVKNGKVLHSEFIPVKKFVGDAQFTIVVPEEYRLDPREDGKVVYNDSRGWGDGITFSPQSETFALDAGLHAVRVFERDGKTIRGMKIEFTKPGLFQMGSRDKFEEIDVRGSYDAQNVTQPNEAPMMDLPPVTPKRTPAPTPPEIRESPLPEAPKPAPASEPTSEPTPTSSSFGEEYRKAADDIKNIGSTPEETKIDEPKNSPRRRRTRTSSSEKKPDSSSDSDKETNNDAEKNKDYKQLFQQARIFITGTPQPEYRWGRERLNEAVNEAQKAIDTGDKEAVWELAQFYIQMGNNVPTAGGTADYRYFDEGAKPLLEKIVDENGEHAGQAATLLLVMNMGKQEDMPLARFNASEARKWMNKLRSIPGPEKITDEQLDAFTRLIEAGESAQKVAPEAPADKETRKRSTFEIDEE